MPVTIEITELRNLRLALHEYLFGLAAQLLRSTNGGTDTQQAFTLLINGLSHDGYIHGVSTELGEAPLLGMIVTVATWVDNPELGQSAIPAEHKFGSDSPVYFRLKITSSYAPLASDEILYEIEDALLKNS